VGSLFGKTEGGSRGGCQKRLRGKKKKRAAGKSERGRLGEFTIRESEEKGGNQGTNDQKRSTKEETKNANLLGA